jgi:pimeloyl-ACP methyl ester carboxylesterase/DNA-binding CsgD family transcriptional regulator
MKPETRYAKIKGTHIAYQVFGMGPLDVVLVPGFVCQVEVAWEDLHLARFLRRIGSIGRVILFDRRGMGMSDRFSDDRPATGDERVEEIEAVMDAAGSERAILVGWSEGGPIAIQQSVADPARTAGLFLISTSARLRWADDYPFGTSDEVVEFFVKHTVENWGVANQATLAIIAPSAADDRRFQEFAARVQRFSCSPGAIERVLRQAFERDVRDLLPRVSVPSMILHRANDFTIGIDHGRYLAERIPGARFAEVPGGDHLFWIGPTATILEALANFARELAPAQPVAPSVRDGAWGVESLTPAESEVVELTVAGLSNKQIAQRLFVSRHTVDTHLKHVFRKLGISSRSQLVAEMARRGT